MRTITMSALREQIELKKAAIGWADDEATTELLRNSGVARSAAKRESLARGVARATMAGRKAVASKY